MRTLELSTQENKQIIDITDLIESEIAKEKIKTGVCHLFILHTTAALTTADLDPGTDLDMLDAFSQIIPMLNYRHPHDPTHVPDHIWSSIIGPSITLPIINGELELGTWQRVILIEFSGPRKRTITLHLTK